MNFNNGVFENIYRTSFSELGTNNSLTNKAFLNFLEDIAGEHSYFSHFSYDFLVDDKLTWILLNWKLQVFKRPKANENLTIKTWGRSANKLYIFRDFEVFDEGNNLCAIASSKWLLYNYEKECIAWMPDNVDKIYNGFYNKSVFEIDDFPKLRDPKANYILEKSYEIHKSDLDTNHHVHNLNYLDIAYEVLPEDVFFDKELNNVEILYKKQIKYGDRVKACLSFENNEYIICIKSEYGKDLHAIVKLF